jgi:hypothetical protein
MMPGQVCFSGRFRLLGDYSVPIASRLMRFRMPYPGLK